MKIFRKLKVNKKLIALMFATFMLASGFGILATWHGFPPIPNTGHNKIIPALSNVGETSSVSMPVSYYTQSSVANTSATTLTLDAVESSNYNTISVVDNAQSWTLASNDTSASITVSLGSLQWWRSGTTYTNPILIEFANGLLSNGDSTVGDVITTLTVNGDGFSGTSIDINSDTTTYSYTDVVIAFDYEGVTGYYPTSITITVGSYGGAFDVAPSEFITYSTTQSAGYYSMNNGISGSTTTGFEYGWTYSGQSVSSSFTIPQYTSSYDITWSTTQTGEMVYSGNDYTSSGSEPGSLTVNTVSFNSDGSDPNVLSYTFSYYLSSQNQVSSVQTTQTASPIYTYAQTSGTTNEASASFSFSGTTPSSAVFVSYETSSNSLATTPTTVVFAPSITVTNPYYTYQQNELVASLTGASTGSSSTSGTENPSFSSSVSYTSSASPSWTVSLSLYGNIIPQIVSDKVAWTGTSDTEELWFNATQPVFSNETLQLQVNWGDGNITTYTSSNTYGNNYNFAEIHSYSEAGTYTVTATISNTPNPANNYLSSLTNSTVFTKTFVISISPTLKDQQTGQVLSSGTVLQQNEAINIFFSSTNNIVGTLSIYQNDGGGFVSVGSETFNTASGEFVGVEPSYEGLFSFTLKLVFDGANETFDYQFNAPDYPTEYSNYVTFYFSNTVSQLTSPSFTNLQVHYWDYNYASAYASNLSEWLYQYDIPNNHSDFIRINFNDTWLFYSASVPVYGAISDSNGSVILNSTNWDTVQLELLEPVSIANPLGELTISYSPSTALAQVAGVKIPFSELTTYVNGKEMVADNYQYVVGNSLSIKTVDIFNQTVASYNITPTSQIENLQIMIPFSQLQFADLNSTYYVDVYVKQNGIEQALTSVLPLQTMTIYIPDSTYNFSFQYHAVNSNTILPSNNYIVMNVNGLGVYFFNGILFYGVNQNLQTTRANLSSLMTNVTITIDANNASIANLLTKINVNLNANDSTITNLIDEIKSTTNLVNSNVTNMLTQLETNFTFMDDLIKSNNISFNNKLAFLNDTIKTLNLNQTAYFNITHDIVSSINLTESQRYQMEADAGTFAYHFVPKNETTNKTGIFVTSWLENTADKPVDNKTLVYEVWKNLTVAYVNLTDNKLIIPHLISYNSYSITIFLPLNVTQLYNLQNDSGKTELSMYSPFVLNSVSNIATGNINPSNAVFLNTTTVPWYVALVANYYPAYSSNPLQEIENILVWILDNAGGRALTLLVGLATLAYFAWMINKSRKDKGEKKWRYRIEKKMDSLYRKVVGES